MFPFKPYLIFTFFLVSTGIKTAMSQHIAGAVEQNIRNLRGRIADQRHGSQTNDSGDAQDFVRKMVSNITNRYIIYGDSKNEVQIMTALIQGEVVLNIPGSLKVVEIPDDTNAAGFVENVKAKGLTIEVDEPVFPDPIKPDKDNKFFLRSQEEKTPWGIKKVFEDANGIPKLPRPGDFPKNITHRICIIDSGYQKSHPDLPNDATNADPSQGEDSANPFSLDRCNHGTHVAGTIAAVDNDQHVIGVYPGAPEMLIVKVFGNNSTDTCDWTYQSNLMAAAAKCKAAGAKIINMSLGSKSSSRIFKEFSQNLNDNDGILSIAAAGNGGDGSYWYPASYPSVMSVAASDVNDDHPSFSQTNDQVDIAAPGVRIKSTVGSNGLKNFRGTSMATPHVAGVAFLLWNKFPACTNIDVREALQASATDKGSPGRDNEFGYGIVNYHAAEIYLINNKACARTEPTQCNENENSFELILETDDHGNETSWDIETTNGTIVESGSGYNSNAAHTINICLPTNACTFTIRDSENDGLCCGNGQGSYKVRMNGEELGSGGEFQTSEVVRLCMESPVVAPVTLPSLAPITAPIAAPSLSPSNNSCSNPILEMAVDDNSQILQLNMKGSNKKMRIKTVDGEFQVEFL